MPVRIEGKKPNFSSVQKTYHMNLDAETNDEETELETIPLPKTPIDYSVGYKKPPKSGQFKKGKSGNPKGRPKGAKNFKTVIQETFQKTKIEITINGKTKKRSYSEVAIIQLAREAAKGKPRSIELLIKLMDKYGLTGTDEISEEANLDQNEAATLEDLVTHYQQSKQDG